jgi:uncharacterized protein (DUF2062 family)
MKKQLSRRKASVVNIKQSLRRFCRYWYLRLVRLQGHPHQIARGVAVGTFSGFIPWMGFQILIAIVLAWLVRGNKIAAMALTWISNPVTNLPIFLFNYKVGEWLLGLGQAPNTSIKMEWDLNSITQLKSLGLNVFITLFFGSFCIGILAGTFSYFLTLAILNRRQKIRRFPARLG